MDAMQRISGVWQPPDILSSLFLVTSIYYSLKVATILILTVGHVLTGGGIVTKATLEITHDSCGNVSQFVGCQVDRLYRS